jgi:hypothetical protein
MPADDRKTVKLESKPIKPISMPEYRYQDYVVSEHYSSVDQSRREAREPNIDLKGVSLNLL